MAFDGMFLHKICEEIKDILANMIIKGDVAENSVVKIDALENNFTFDIIC